MTSPTAEGLMSRMRSKRRARSVRGFKTLATVVSGRDRLAIPGGARGSADAGEQFLHPGGDAVAQDLAAGGAARGDPVELDDPAGADKGLVAVEGVVAAAEGNQGALHGRHLDQHVLEIVG